MPNCCCTVGSELVASILPKSNGSPAYWSTSGSTDETGTVVLGNTSGEPARVAPGPGEIGAPSFVTSCVQTPL